VTRTFYVGKPSNAEEKMKIFKQTNAGLTPDKGTNFYSRMYQMESKLDEALLRLREERNKNESLKQQIIALENQPEDSQQELFVTVPREKTPLEIRIESMKLKLDTLQLQYTEKHPDVVSATDNWLDALMAWEALNNKRRTEILITDVWRSLNANRRAGNIT